MPDASKGTGWWKPAESRKWHFFDASARSLCGKWMHMGARLKTGNDDSPDNCSACRRKFAVSHPTSQPST